jgi:hypothetical protein
MSIELNSVGEKLSKLNSCETNEDFIAICITLNEEGIGRHSGIIICYEEELVFFHFDGNVKLEILQIDEIPNNYYIKKTSIFEDDKILGFKAYCEILSLEVSPNYGFIFTNSFYNTDGKYYCENNLPDITTCVGFCINVIRGFLYNNDKYINIEDWDDSSLEEFTQDFEVIEAQLSYIEGIDISRLEEIKNSFFKRIKPSELTSSAFFKEVPIRKVDIDFVNPTVQNLLQIKHLT